MVTRSFGQLVVVILLLVSYLTPVMACTVSGVRMNDEERACCQAMQNRCEQMGMPASHSCCHKMPQSARDHVLATKAFTYRPVAVVAIWLTAAKGFHPAFAATSWVEDLNDSPPQSPSGSISVLRI